MNHLVVHHANEVDEVTVAITAPLPYDAQNVMRSDAYLLAYVLRSSLPGGTLDRLIARLLELKASDLHVSYAKWDTPEEQSAKEGGSIHAPQEVTA